MHKNGNGHDPSPENEDSNVIRFSPRTASPDPQGKAEPLLNLPPLTGFMTILFIAIYVVTGVLLGDQREFQVIFNFGFIPGRYSGVVEPGWQAFVSPFTYVLLHGSWLHVIMNTVMLLAFGAGVERWMGARRMLFFFIMCGLISVATQFALDPSSTNPVIGASGGISGLFAAALVMMYESGRLPAGKYGLVPLVTFWVAISVIFGIIGAPDGSAVAWAAHIGGFLGGFILLKLMRRKRAGC